MASIFLPRISSCASRTVHPLLSTASGSTRILRLSQCTRFYAHTPCSKPGAIQQSLRRSNSSKSSKPSFAFKAAGVAAVGIGISSFVKQPIQCECVHNFFSKPNSYLSPLSNKKAPTPPVASQAGPAFSAQNPPPPQSSVNVYELSFGTVCGVCAGIFIKKGAKMLAFVLGGVFVLLQYLGSFSLVKVDWGRVASRFENAFYTTDAATGARRAPSIVSVWRWLVDFLTADFQPRATFIAGLALGLRIG